MLAVRFVSLVNAHSPEGITVLCATKLVKLLFFPRISQFSKSPLFMLIHGVFCFLTIVSARIFSVVVAPNTDGEIAPKMEFNAARNLSKSWLAVLRQYRNPHIPNFGPVSAQEV